MRTHTHTCVQSIPPLCSIPFHAIPFQTWHVMTCHETTRQDILVSYIAVQCCTVHYPLDCTALQYITEIDTYTHTHKQKQVNKEAHALWACFELLWAHTWLQSDTEFKQKQAWSFGFHIIRMRPCLFIPPYSERVSTYAREWTISYEIINPSPWVTTGTDVRYCLKSKNVQGIDCILWVLEPCFRGHI